MKKERGVHDWLHLVLVVVKVFISSVAVTAALLALVHWIFGVDMDTFTLALAVGVGCSFASFMAGFLNRRIVKPIRTLCTAMQQVARGDFKEHMTTTSNLNAVRELYAHYNLMIDELAATETLQSDFVSNVSHEFKTPISAIEGYATLLQNPHADPAQQQKYVERILLNTGRLSGLVGDILLLSRLENLSIRSPGTWFRLDEQVRRAILLLEDRWMEKQIDWDVDMECIDCCGNEGLLLHVWSNLVDNAVKFSPEGGRVSIRLHSGQQHALFTIEDEGPGIPEASMGHIFDKFYQADPSHTQKGSGLGLALAQRIVALSGGDIHAQNLPQRGCRFSVSLPLDARQN